MTAAAGLVLMAASRPYEGLVVALSVLAFAGVRDLLRRAIDSRTSVLAALGVLAAGGILLMTYNRAATGDWFRMPYQESLRQYGSRRMFVFQAHRPEPAFRHAALQQVYRSLYRTELTTADRWRIKVLRPLAFYTNWAFIVALLFVPFVVRDRRFRPLLLIAGLLVAALALEEWLHPHYAAPGTFALVAVVVQSLRHMRAARWRLARVSFLLLLGASTAVTAARGLYRWWSVPPPARWDLHRERIANHLAGMSGKHLVVVRYSSLHNPHTEWVYNSADIDGSRVVWARSMADNTPLEGYFKDRQFWEVEADAKVPLLRPYRPEEGLAKAHVTPGKSFER
jgi:hypothetical protein